MIKGRIAPTPSGYLHIGNAFNFVLTWLHVRALDGQLVLRIDDLDEARSKTPYIEDIFRVLEFLELDWDLGPFSVTEHQQKFSQKHRIPLYQAARKKLRDKGELFACDCTRKSILERTGDTNYDGFCLERNLDLDAPDIYWRLASRLPEKVQYELHPTGFQKIPTDPESQYVVLKRKKGFSSYQLASLVDDVHWKINTIIRGEDLLQSTAIQLHLAKLLKASSFKKCRFLHHQLIEVKGKKLSKSSSASPILKKFKNPAEFYANFSSRMGWKVQAHSAQEALSFFKQQR